MDFLNDNFKSRQDFSYFEKKQQKEIPGICFAGVGFSSSDSLSLDVSAFFFDAAAGFVGAGVLTEQKNEK